jgi:hypothetical protein
MHYFVSRELFIAHTLSRHFSWSHNVLIPETDLPRNAVNAKNVVDSNVSPTVIVLSGNDSIVPARETADYLIRCQKNATSSTGKDQGLFELVWLEGAQHGELCLHSEHLDMVQTKILERCPPRGHNKSA